MLRIVREHEGRHDIISADDRQDPEQQRRQPPGGPLEGGELGAADPALMVYPAILTLVLASVRPLP